MFSASRDRSVFAVALTGGIASGKSAVAQQFETLQVPVFDADVAAHALVQKGQEALIEISSTFGRDVLAASGELDRKKMREIVFDDAHARRKLETILHPKIHANLVAQVENCKLPYCILAIPLFAECRDDYRWVDRVLVTDVPRDVQIRRLTKRTGIDSALAERIIDAQASREQRLGLASDIVDNTAPIDKLSNVVARLHERYSTMASARRT